MTIARCGASGDGCWTRRAKWPRRAAELLPRHHETERIVMAFAPNIIHLLQLLIFLKDEKTIFCLISEQSSQILTLSLGKNNAPE
jgi:hypothetical protein